jgi:hypothetical protein
MPNETLNSSPSSPPTTLFDFPAHHIKALHEVGMVMDPVWIHIRQNSIIDVEHHNMQSTRKEKEMNMKRKHVDVRKRSLIVHQEVLKSV